MNFKEALIAHLQGENVECRLLKGRWMPIGEYYGHLLSLRQIMDEGFGCALDYRLAPRTITVNGVEVPAPESAPLADGRMYFIASPHVDSWAFSVIWSSSDADGQWIERGLVYLNKEDAIARAKAMLLCK